MSDEKSQKKWVEAVRNAPEFRCGRLDMSSYTGDGEMFRNVYVGDEVKQIRGPWCDEIAFAAADYRRVLAELDALKAELKRYRSNEQ